MIEIEEIPPHWLIHFSSEKEWRASVEHAGGTVFDAPEICGHPEGTLFAGNEIYGNMGVCFPNGKGLLLKSKAECHH